MVVGDQAVHRISQLKYALCKKYIGLHSYVRLLKLLIPYAVVPFKKALEKKSYNYIFPHSYDY